MANNKGGYLPGIKGGIRVRKFLMSLGLAALLLTAVVSSLLPLAETASAVAAANTRDDAAARADQPIDVAGWLALMPELAGAPAPPWLKVGTRITYHVMSVTREGDTTSAGESLVQYDIVLIDATTVLATVGIHVKSGSGALGAVRDIGFVMGVPGVGDVWMDPAALAKAEKHADKELTITHTSMNINGIATKAVRFEYIQGATRSVNVFDEAKGALLYRIQASGSIETAKQSSVVSEFMSIRQMAPAWTGGVTPDWAAVDVVLKYEGTMTTNLGYGAPGPPLPLAMLCRITNSSPAGVCVKWETFLSGVKIEERYSLSSSALPSGGIFLPQTALASLKAGKVLDTDPVTGMSVSVAQSPLTIDGKQLLVITHEGQTFKRLYGYDNKTGMLTYFNETPPIGVQIELKLTGVSR